MEARKEPPWAQPRVSPASRPLLRDAARLDPALRKVQSNCDKWIFGGALTSPLLFQNSKKKKKFSSGLQNKSHLAPLQNWKCKAYKLMHF